MLEKERREPTPTNSDQAKLKFRQALEKKKLSNRKSQDSLSRNSKIQGNQSVGGTTKMFRRKSGSA